VSGQEEQERRGRREEGRGRREIKCDYWLHKRLQHKVLYMTNYKYSTNNKLRTENKVK
jgi:hypothetical protein